MHRIDTGVYIGGGREGGGGGGVNVCVLDAMRVNKEILIDR